jgi:peptidoglycan/xylan/chitin deacetylase (PgdA/CDA1 family)
LDARFILSARIRTKIGSTTVPQPDPVRISGSLQTIHVGQVRDRPHLAWAEGLSFCIPAEVVRRTGLDRQRTGSGEIIISGDTGAPDTADYQSLRMRAAYTSRPTSARLPFSYRRIPGWMRSLLASAVGRWHRSRTHSWAAFPQWPLDLSVDFLADLCNSTGKVPAGGATPVILSHDLDSAEGLRNVVRDFLPIEEEVGARSTNYVVPCGWPLDEGLLRDLAARGHEIGVHGYDHSNLTAFASDAERRRRLDAACAAMTEYTAVGYRAPSLLRSAPLLRDLASRYRYDSSIPTSGGLFPTPNNGCATARPFRIGSILEIPLTLPRDGSLRFLGFAPDEILDCWTTLANVIAASRGVVVILTHCEERFSGNRPMREAYREFVCRIAASDMFYWTTARDLQSRWISQNPGLEESRAA